MYNGTSAGKEEDLLFSGSAKEARRAVHSFALFDASCTVELILLILHASFSFGTCGPGGANS
jgi:hypothetical protein